MSVRRNFRSLSGQQVGHQDPFKILRYNFIAIKLTIPNLHNKRVTGDGDELWLKEGLDGWTNSSSCWFAVEFTRLCFLLTLWLALPVKRVPHNGFGSTKSTLIPLSLSLCMSLSVSLSFSLFYFLSLSLSYTFWKSRSQVSCCKGNSSLIFPSVTMTFTM